MVVPSIQRRLMAILVLSQSLLAAGLLAAGVFYTDKRLDAGLDAAMQGRIMSLAALVRFSEDGSGKLYFDQSLVPSPIDPRHPDLYSIWTDSSPPVPPSPPESSNKVTSSKASLQLLARSDNWPSDFQVDSNPRQRLHFKLAEVHYRGIRVSRIPVLDREESKTDVPPSLTIVYASPTEHVEEQVYQAGVFIALCSLALLGCTALLGVWGIRQGLLPLSGLADEARRVSAQQWQLRVPEDAQQIKELQPLTQAMTEMLGRLERSFVQQREFVGNAAHELKTPVAILKSTLQSLLQRPRSLDEYQAGLQASLEDLDRLEQLLQWMLRLARAEQRAAGTPGSPLRDLIPIDLRASCEESIERLEALALARNVSIRFDSQTKAMVRADAEDLQMIWMNLLENGIRYSPEGGVVAVRIEGKGDNRVQVTVEDQGPGISAQDLPHVFERFFRGDQSRNRATGGFGLGLAIAKALVETYAGGISAENIQSPDIDAPPNRVGSGTRMTVELPIE